MFLVSLKYEAAFISKIHFPVFSFTHVYLPFDNMYLSFSDMYLSFSDVYLPFNSVNLSFKYVLNFQ